MTETKTFYPGEYNRSDYSYDSISGEKNPVGKGSDNAENYATINLKTGSRATTHTRWPFDCSSIPPGATIDSVSCKVAALTSSNGTTFVSEQTLQLHSGTSPKGSATNISHLSRNVYTLSCGTWTRDELQSCNLYIYAKRSTSSPTTSRRHQFYGADLTVTYTYQGERFLLKLGGKYNDIARVFKKVSGIWVEQTDLANVIEDGVRYQNGGFWEDPTKTITITGTGHADRAAVIVNGVTYTTAQSIKVQKGTVITLHNKLWDSTVASSNKIVVDGVSVVSGGGDYNYTVNNDCTIALYSSTSSSKNYGTITVTTVYDSGSNPTVVLDGVTYEFEEGMTWTQWCNSSYNTGGWYIRNGEVYNGSKWIYDPVLASYGISEALIVAGRAYQANG